VGNGRTNEGLSEIRDLNEDEVQRNNQYSESSVAMVQSGPRLLMTLELKHFNLSSQKKFQPVLLSVQIPGKHTPVSLREDTSTVTLITAKNSTAMEKEIINGLVGVWRYLKRKLVSKGGIRREKLPLYLGEYVWRYNHRNENDNVKVKRIVKLLQHEV
jgi:transposase-like protein